MSLRVCVACAVCELERAGVRARACIHVWVHASALMRARDCVRVCTQVCAAECVRARAHTYVCVCPCMRACICARVHVIAYVFM